MNRLPTILIADDDPGMQRLLSTALTRFGYQVTITGNGREALERASSAAPDLFLIDLLMPGMDGYTLATRLRRQPELVDVPIVMLSAEPEEVHQGLSRALGITAFLSKPVDVAELKDKCAELLEGAPR